PQINRKLAWSLFAGGVLLLGASVGVAFLPNGEAQSPTTLNQGPGSAYSYGQQGGITAGTVNITPQRAEFTPQLGNELLEHMPAKDKKVFLRTVGSVDDQKIGTGIQKFLIPNGYTVQRERIGMLVPPPSHPFSMSENKDEYIITVAPTAH
ncbi:MAG TPA: hypothetical protein VMF67_14755, partial [Rhizomicrobium sp.]|nr:hypothetical protein [Rhizomicrobium sp.]